MGKSDAQAQTNVTSGQLKIKQLMFSQLQRQMLKKTTLLGDQIEIMCINKTLRNQNEINKKSYT